MKKEQRIPFLELAKEVDWPLCGLCKYELCYGSICESDLDCECVHPLAVFPSWPWWDDAPFIGDDCWGFRPMASISFCADIVGAMLQHGWRSAQWWEEGGVWKVTGTKIEA